MKTLTVLLHGETTGWLEEEAGLVTFRFASEYWRRHPRPVLGRWFEDGTRDQIYRGGSGLPAWFDNLEPEGALASHLARKYDLDAGPLALLAACGMDLPGAVQLRSERSPGKWSLAEVHAGTEPDGWSLAGVHLKLSVKPGKTDRLTISSPDGFANGILKVPPPSRWKGLSENEHATMSWARRAGFDVPRTSVVPPEAVTGGLEGVGRSLFLVERYDRTPDGPVHQEDMLQVMNLRSDWKGPREPHEASPATPEAHRREHLTRYEGLGLLVQHLLGSSGVEEYLRRLVLMLVTGNGDAHLKNWSVIYPDRLRPQWSPLYDQVSTIAWDDGTLALPFYGATSFSAVGLPQLTRLGEACGFGAPAIAELIDQTVLSLHEAWRGEEFPKAHADRLRVHWKKRPLTRTHALLAGR